MFTQRLRENQTCTLELARAVRITEVSPELRLAMSVPLVLLAFPLWLRVGQDPRFLCYTLKKMYSSPGHGEYQVILTSIGLSVVLTTCFPARVLVLSSWKSIFIANLQAPPFLRNLWFSCPCQQPILLQRFWLCAGSTGNFFNPAPIVSPSVPGHPDLIPGSLDTCPLSHCIGWRIQPSPYFWLSFASYPKFLMHVCIPIPLFAKGCLASSTQDRGLRAWTPLIIWQKCLLCASVSSKIGDINIYYIPCVILTKMKWVNICKAWG